MIKLILFDIGGVICEDRRDQFLKQFTTITGLSLKKLHKRTFPGSWHIHDKGLLTKKQTWSRIMKRIPNAKKLPRSYQEAGNQFYPHQNMISYIQQLKKRTSILIGDLSNMSAQMHTALIQRGFPFKLFNPRFLSYQLKMRKPEKQIYCEVMKRTGLKGSEILFIDDNMRNIKAARKFGWKTIHFTTLKKLKIKIKKFI